MSYNRLRYAHRHHEVTTTPATAARPADSGANLLTIAAGLSLCLLALALRLFRLEFQSLWWDEGVSLYLASLPLSGLTVAKDFMVDLHPPLYHALLGVWTRAAGSSAFSARFLSVACGVAMVPAAFAVGRMLGGRLAGLIAAALVAGSQFEVFYSQEVRMYPLVALLGLVSVWLCVRALDATAGRGALLALAGVNLIGLHTYYYLGLLVLAENVVAVVWLARDRRRLVRWLGWQVGCLLLCVPWLLTLWAGTAGGALEIPPERVVRWSLAGFLRESLVDYAVGFAHPRLWADAAAALALVAGAWGSLRSGLRSRGWWLAGVAIVGSLLAAYALGVARPFLFPRFVIWVQPLFAAAAGAGLARLLLSARGAGVGARVSPAGGLRLLGGLAALATLGLLVAGNYRSLAEHYTTPRTAYSTSDYRVALASVAERAQPGDTIVGGYPWQLGYAAAYVPRAGARLLYLAGADAPERAVAAGGVSGRTWLLLYSQDRAWVSDRTEAALARSGPTAFVDQFGDTRVRLFAPPTPAAAPPLASLGDSIQLLAADQQPRLLPASGGAVELALTWSATSRPTRDYTVFVHLIGTDNSPRAQSDGPPIGGAFPTSTWTPGTVYVDRHRLVVPPGTAAGSYRLAVGMYLPSTGERLPTRRSPEEQDRVLVGTVTIER